MTDPDDRETIRRRKAKELQRSVTATEDDADETASGDDTAQPSDPIHIDSPDHFREVITRHNIVLADFYADWCGPCQMLEPTVEQLASESPAAVVKIDVDTHQSLAGEYGVQGVPTLILFADGSPVEQLVGVREKHHYEQLISQYAE